MKALGADIKDFYERGFPDGYYHDDNIIDFHDDAGNWVLEDDKRYDLTLCGVLVKEAGNDVVSFGYALRNYLKSRKSKTFSVSVPTVRIEEFKLAARDMGCKIL